MTRIASPMAFALPITEIRSDLIFVPTQPQLGSHFDGRAYVGMWQVTAYASKEAKTHFSYVKRDQTLTRLQTSIFQHYRFWKWSR